MSEDDKVLEQAYKEAVLASRESAEPISNFATEAEQKAGQGNNSQDYVPVLRQNDTDDDMDSLLDDALNDFQSRAGPSETANPASSSGRSSQPSFDPLHKGVNAKSKRLEEQSSSSSSSTAPRSPASAFNPLPARKGRKATKKPPSSSSDASTIPHANASEPLLQKIMEELKLAENDVSQGGSQHDQEKMSQTLRALSEEASRLQTEQNATHSSSDMFNEPMFAGLQDELLRGGSGEAGGMGGLADALMRQLLSKDVLQQPLQEIGEQYPGWLEKNREKLKPEELRNYQQQYGHIQQILHIYEHDADNYSRLFTELHQMQQCGQPPEDIVKEMAPGLAFGNDGMPQLPGDPNTCCIQ